MKTSSVNTQACQREMKKRRSSAACLQRQRGKENHLATVHLSRRNGLPRVLVYTEKVKTKPRRRSRMHDMSTYEVIMACCSPEANQDIIAELESTSSPGPDVDNDEVSCNRSQPFWYSLKEFFRYSRKNKATYSVYPKKCVRFLCL